MGGVVRGFLKILVILAIVTLAGCAGSDENANPSDDAAKPGPAVGAPEAPGEEDGEEETGGEEAPVPPAESLAYNLSIEGDNVVIKKAFLGARVLMMPTLIAEAAPATTSQVFGTKIVYFDRKGSSVYLMEDMEGKTITDPYEPVRLVAQFPIVEENDESIVFDFRSGLNNLIVTSGDYDSSQPSEYAFPVAASYIEEHFTDERMFSVNHIAQVAIEGQAFTVTFNYAFVTDDSSDIEALLPDELRRYGYFLTKPAYEKTTGKQSHFVHRWDISKPIVFYVSSNTPPEYFDSVKEGILGWNKAFGREVVRAEAAPEGVVSGDPRYNLIQWVGFDDAGFAYANWHAHPRTGEILNAYVIMTSVFAIGSRDRARALLEQFGDDEPSAAGAKAKIGLAGFEDAGMGGEEFYKPVKQFLSLAASGDISDDDILKISKLYVREVVMHEVGHDLGLRHNFFGNIGSEIPPEDDRAPLMEAVRTGKYDGPLPSSSIMDYSDFRDAILMHSPGKYDVMAIEWAYGLGETKENPPIYCTDGDVGKNVDCDRFDGGSDPVIWRENRIADFASTLSNAIEKKYFQGKDIAIPGPYEMTSYLTGLVGYLDASREVLDIAARSSADRRAYASGVMSKYLRASDENYNSLTALVSDDLLKRISSQASKEGSYVLDYLNSIRYTYVSATLGQLAQLVSGDVPRGEGEKAAQIPAEAMAQIPIAEATAGIVANHVTVRDASETPELRFTAAAILMSLHADGVDEIRKDAAAKLGRNIEALRAELSTIKDAKARADIESQISIEESLLAALR